MIDLDKIRELFEGKLTASVVGMPIQYENVDDGADLTSAKAAKTKWARIVIKDGDAQGVSCGSNVLRRYSGVVIVSIFYPFGGGTKPIRDTASTVSDFIVKESCTSLFVRTPFLTIIGKTDDWFQVNLTIPFEFDQFTL